MEDLLKRIDLTGQKYTVKQSLFRNKYRVLDGDGNLVLKGRQKMFKMKEEFPFTDPDGNVVFRVKAENLMDIAGDYAVIDEETGDSIASLEKKFTLFKHVWKIRDPETDALWARVESGSALIEFLRSISSIFSLLPHSYTIEDQDGSQIGTIKGKFSLKDTYSIEIQDTDTVPREAVVAAAVTIDALEGN